MSVGPTGRRERGPSACPMPFDPAERAFVERARVGRLATANAEGRPHAVPVCYALVDDQVLSAIDAKPKQVGPHRLRRVRNVRANPEVSLIVDRYTDDWDALAWVRVDGTARVLDPGEDVHADGVTALRDKYDQYADHPLEQRPALAIEPERVVSWGRLDGSD